MPVSDTGFNKGNLNSGISNILKKMTYIKERPLQLYVHQGQEAKNYKCPACRTGR